MEHFARWVVRHRKAVLAAAVLLLIPSVFGAAGTYINYDILTYLPPELDSMVGEGYLVKKIKNDGNFKTAIETAKVQNHMIEENTAAEENATDATEKLSEADSHTLALNN